MREDEGVRTKLTFETNIADISLSHLLELMLTLGSYKKGLVVVGGWVPYLLLKQFQNKDVTFQHQGSKDIDIAVNPAVINETQYASLVELLQGRGYHLKEGRQFSYIKKVTSSIGEDIIQVDFLAPEYGGTAKSHRHQKIQDDFLSRKARGADIAFLNPVEFTLEGKLPNNADATATFYIASILGILTMKGYVLGQRYKEKDAYDIYSLVRYYKNGADSVAEEIKPYMHNTLVKEALESMKEHFKTRTSMGPMAVADFLQETGEAREETLTQAHLQIQRLLKLLEI